MRKNGLVFFLIIIFGVINLVFGGYIIISPKQGESWDKFGIHTIKWMNMGDKRERVNIYLYDKSGKKIIINIAKNIDNKGEYFCGLNTFRTIPDNEYLIFIVSETGKILGKSKIFKITDSDNKEKTVPPAENKIMIKAPIIQIEIRRTKNLDIHWETKEKTVKNFIIELYNYDKTRKIKEITRLTPLSIRFSVKPVLKNIFNYSWVIPSNIPPGKYYIKISIPGKNVFTFSPSITIKLPKNIDKFKRGKEKK